MAKYCEKCGAYIPDGQTQCLACGFDPAVQTAKQTSTSGGYAYQTGPSQDYRYSAPNSGTYYANANKNNGHEQERNSAEEERRKRQEESRAWAEEEYARRQQEKQKQWDEMRKHSYTNTIPSFSRSSSAQSPDADNLLLKKILCCLAYVNVLWVLPLMLYKDDKFAQFHAKQGLTKFAAYAILAIIGKIFRIGGVFSILFMLASIKGMIGAANNRMDEIPVIGKLMKKFFR